MNNPTTHQSIRTALWASASLLLLPLWGCALERSKQHVEPPPQAWSELGLNGRQFATEHFDLISTLTDSELESALPAFLEAAHRKYETVLSVEIDPEARLETYVFATRAEWTRFARHHYPLRYEVYSRIRSGGFTQRRTSLSFFASRATTLATLAHEGWHQYVGAHVKTPIPAWLDEGIACCHEAIDFSSARPKFTPRHNTFRINALREAVQRNSLLPLAEIINTNSARIISQNNSGVAHTYYAQAWALVTLLRHGAGGRHTKSFSALMRDIARGTFAARISATRLTETEGDPLSLGQAALRAYFDCTPQELAGEYYDHIIRITGF